MAEFDTAQLIYLVLLGGAILMWFFAQNRNSLGKTAQHALVWGLIFMGVIACVGLWGDIQRTVGPRQAVFADNGQIELPRAQDGHYYLTADVNGTPVNFVVDTGASQIVLTEQDAKRAGLDIDALVFLGRASTANGEVRTAPVTLDSFSVGIIHDQRLRAVVNEGQMRQSLLGMDYLQRFSSIEIIGGQLILKR